MEKVRPPCRTGWPLKVAGHKGYRYPRVRAWLERGSIVQVIPQRSDEVHNEGKRHLDGRAYKRRSRIEICVGCLKENRRVGTRDDKLAANFLAFVNLAIVRSYLRILSPDDPSDKT